MILDIIVEPDGGAYHAFCPMLPGLHVAGGTEKEALRNAGDALSAYVESMIEHGDPLPHSRSEARRFRAQRGEPDQEERGLDKHTAWDLERIPHEEGTDYNIPSDARREGDPHWACPTDAVCGQYGDAPCRAARP